MKKIVRSLLFFFAHMFTTRKPDADIYSLALDKAYRVGVPTYDGSGQAVHPSILVQDTAPRYIMAFTPYTDTHDNVENPSVVISDDGLSFREEKPGLNPLVPAPEFDHNDDPDLFFQNGKYSVLYLETKRPLNQTLFLLESTDRISWEKKELFSASVNPENHFFMLSPTYVEKGGMSYLFYVNRDGTEGYCIEYVTGKDIYSLDFTHRTSIRVNILPEDPWHLDIICHDNGYIMLLTVAKEGEQSTFYSLHLAESDDLIHWNICRNFFLPNCYRSSGFVEDGILYIYLSKIYIPTARRKKWKILLYKTDISALQFATSHIRRDKA